MDIFLKNAGIKTARLGGEWGVRGGGGWWDRQLLFNRCRVPVLQDENMVRR